MRIHQFSQNISPENLKKELEISNTVMFAVDRLLESTSQKLGITMNSKEDQKESKEIELDPKEWENRDEQIKKDKEIKLDPKEWKNAKNDGIR